MKMNKLENRGFERVMVSLEEAYAMLLQYGTLRKEHLDLEKISLWEAGNRILACDTVAQEAVPPFDRSPLDGFAVCSEDTRGASHENPCRLKVIEEVPAGHVAKKNIEKCTAIKVLTGAPVPLGADAVIRYEETIQKEDSIYIWRPVKAGESVAPKGEDIALGQCVLKAGTILKPAHLAVLASLGREPISVKPVPKIGLFCTGDELCPVQGTLGPGKIRVTNIYPLAQLIRQAGGQPVDLGLIPDQLDAVKEVYARAESMGLDLVVSTGGVAAGDYDVVKDAMLAAGARSLFWKVAVRPGAPVAVAEKNNRVWIGLSGSPAGAIVITLLLVAPLVAALAGKDWTLKRQKAVLTVNLQSKKDLCGYWWARIWNEEGRFLVEPLSEQHCGVIKSYMNSNCLLKIPAGQVDLPTGSLVDVLLI